jgi:hypothetical protein
MVEGKKLGLAGLITAAIASIVGGAKAGNLYIQNYTSEDIPSKQGVLIKDNSSDLAYLPQNMYPFPALFIKDSNNTQFVLKSKGINPKKTEIVKLYFESVGVPSGIDHSIKLKLFKPGDYGSPPDPNDYATRNLTLHQEPNNLDADPNLYDIKDLTNWGTEYGYINFPTFDDAQWIFRSDNYADLTFNGKVDLEDFAVWADSWLRNDCNSANHWCDFADLDRSGSVDFVDYSLFGNEAGYDTNDPNTYSRLTPKVNGINVFDDKYLKAFRQDAAKRFYGEKELL